MRQKARCFWILSILWQCCLLVVRRYFCSARAMEGNIARAASRTSIMSDGVACSSSFFILRTCVKASSTATTSLTMREQTDSSQLTVTFLHLCVLNQCKTFSPFLVTGCKKVTECSTNKMEFLLLEAGWIFIFSFMQSGINTAGFIKNEVKQCFSLSFFALNHKVKKTFLESNLTGNFQCFPV